MAANDASEMTSYAESNEDKDEGAAIAYWKWDIRTHYWSNRLNVIRCNGSIAFYWRCARFCMMQRSGRVRQYSTDSPTRTSNNQSPCRSMAENGQCRPRSAAEDTGAALAVVFFLALFLAVACFFTALHPVTIPFNKVYRVLTGNETNKQRRSASRWLHRQCRLTTTTSKEAPWLGLLNQVVVVFAVAL